MNALSPRWGGVAALVIVAALCGVALRPSAVRAQVSALIATAEQHGHTRVIVTLDTAGAAEQVLAWLPASQQARQIGALPLLALDDDALTLRALASDSRVRALSEDTLLAPADTSSNAIIGAPAAWAAG